MMMRWGIACVLGTMLLGFSVLGQEGKKPPAKKSTMPIGMKTMAPNSEKWGDVPPQAMDGTPSVEMGGTMKVAVIQGDPMTAGRTYTLRLSCADGVKIAPHWHPTTENVTIVKGAAAFGMGAKWDDAALKEVGTGGFFSAPPRMVHFAQCKGDSILQVHGVGPFLIHFVGPNESAPVK